MEYITEILKFTVKTKVMAERIQNMANEKAKLGYELVSFSVTPFPKVIMVFKKSE